MLALVPPISISAVLPELVLMVAGCAALLVGQLRNARNIAPGLAVGALVLALLILRGPEMLGGQFHATEGSLLQLNSFAGFVRVSTLIVGILITLVCWNTPRADECGEFFSMLLFALGGLMLVGGTSDLLLLFLAIEVTAIPTYVLVTLSRTGPRSLEAGTKYFYLGALSAAMTAYGLGLLYGAAGRATIDSTAIGNVQQALSSPGSLHYAVAIAGLVLATTGLLFKLAAAPLHFYVAEVYQGASSSVAGLLGFVPKMSGIVALLKIMTLTGWQTVSFGGLFWVLWVVAALSMTIGNVLALKQSSIKRMLAYSGVAHAGYMLVGVLAGAGAGKGMMGDGAAAVLYYVVVYGIANLGAFALLGVLSVKGQPCETLRDVAGLLRRNPVEALLMALAMFALMGLPPTPGFWGKVSLFGSALSAASAAGESASAAGIESQRWLVTLVIIAVVNSAIGAAYYLRVIAAVLLYENDEPADRTGRMAPQYGALLCGLLLLAFTFYPSGLMSAGQAAATSLRDVPVGFDREAARRSDSSPNGAERKPGAIAQGDESHQLRAAAN